MSELVLQLICLFLIASAVFLILNDMYQSYKERKLETPHCFIRINGVDITSIKTKQSNETKK